MKKLILLFAVLSLNCLQVMAQTDIKSTFNVVFYNVENLFDTIDDPRKRDNDFLPTSEQEWTYERYQQKLKKLSAVLSSIAGNELPEIVGLCEVENRAVVEELFQTNELKKGKYQIIHQESPDGRGIDNALAIRKGELNVLCTEFLAVQLENSFSRDIVYVSGTTKVGDTLHLFINHWPSRSGGQEKSEPNRLLAAQILKQKVLAIQQTSPNAKIIITGDFNDYPINESIQTELGATGNPETKAGELFNMMFDLHVNQGRGSYNYRGEWGALDQFIISHALLNADIGWDAEPNSADFYYRDFLLYETENEGMKPSRTYGGKKYYGGYSDHLPIILKLNLKK